MRKTNIESGKILSLLLQLELKGIVQQLPGKYFALFENKTD
jgi:predicted Rossmann fold nucleotide-binding protein DprA/Smf involved in DNA uptake